MRLKELFTKFPHKIWFIAALFLIFHFLVIGMPFPPSALYVVSEKFMSTQPGYTDFTSGAMTQQMLESNVSTYNSYLIKLLIVIAINIVAYLLLFSIVITLTWNYIYRSVLSLKNYWKGILYNFILMFIAIPLMLLFYTGTAFFSKGPVWSIYFFAGLFCICSIISLIAFYTWLNAIFYKNGSLMSVFTDFSQLTVKFIAKLLFVFIVSMILLSFFSWITDYFISSENVVAIVAVALESITVAALSLYVGKCVSVSQNDSKNKKRIRG